MSPWRFLPSKTCKSFFTKFKSNIDAHWMSGGQLRRFGFVLPPSDPKNCLIKEVIDLHELHVWNSAHAIYHMKVIQKSWTNQNLRSATPGQTHALLAYWGSIRPSSATHSKLEVLKVYYIVNWPNPWSDPSFCVSSLGG